MHSGITVAMPYVTSGPQAARSPTFPAVASPRWWDLRLYLRQHRGPAIVLRQRTRRSIYQNADGDDEIDGYSCATTTNC